MKTEILYGIHPVHEMLSAGRRRVYEIYLAKEKNTARLKPIISLAESRGISRQTIGSANFKALVGPVVHQGVAARVSPYPLATLTEILQTSQAGDDRFFLLMLDSLIDPQNLGALIRTALCAGIDGVILPKDNCATPTTAVSRASAGALEHIKLSRVTNLVQTIKLCKNRGLWIIGLLKDAQQSIYAGDLAGSIALVLGGEQKGLRPLVRKNCDFLFSIPQQGPVDSLNASAAGAVAMYEAWRQRQER
ncbi:23S rRNA (guanosine(2251)-2'-O)-methyltransferase (EC [Olavius sp. associated proteobacterium Delta 1]|nr:23S rRNA (guanosine(2251)-2'-O)-methyltransferase (EC [Olavius sp. associated proteobacterium Delta 1]